MKEQSDFVKSLNGEGPFAFPFVAHGEALCTGMTLRDYLAAKAMQTLIGIDNDDSRDKCASLSYLMADAMIAARAGIVGSDTGRAQLQVALQDCVSVMERELNGLAVIQPELRQARAALAAAGAA